jgi:hypothetical protein
MYLIDRAGGIVRMTGKPEETGTHIWLRYATQFSSGGRSYTIEMGIPVPLGATAETREKLIREAEAGMEQLSTHVEKHITKVAQRVQPGEGKKGTSQPPRSVPPKPASQPPPPAAGPAPAAPVQNPPAPAEEIEVPPNRPQIGLPSTARMVGDESGNMSRPQFLQFIRESLGMNPKQAMERLQVRSLDGLNLREALKELQRLVLQDANNPAPSPAAQPEDNQQSRPVPHPKTEEHPAPTPITLRSATSAAPTTTAQPSTPPAASVSPVETERSVVRESPRPIVFDEEDEDEEGGYAGNEELEEDVALTAEDLVLATTVLTRLREARGSAPSSAQRLSVLKNVMDTQLSQEDLLQLVQGIWGVSAVNKLKKEQLEALISWAKEDDFTTEAEMVLALLQEEQYARSDR